MKKEHAEKLFVENLIKIGIEKYWCMEEKGRFYWKFCLKNGQYRYWTNLSQENQLKLGIIVDW